MDEIEQYIQFAIDNGYIHYQMNILLILARKWDLKNTDKTDIYTVYWLIQQKEFIEAIARGIEKQSDEEWFLLKEWGDWTSCTYWLYTEWYWPEDRIEIELISDVTHYQAIAIRENKLEEFITNLNLWNI